jgi:hypothetical protein
MLCWLECNDNERNVTEEYITVATKGKKAVRNTNARMRKRRGVSLEQTAEGKSVSSTFASTRESGGGSAWEQQRPSLKLHGSSGG